MPSRLTLDLGLRYEWHVTPTERDNKFIVFDACADSLSRVGVDRRRDLRAEQPQLRAARRRRLEMSPTAAPCCARRTPRRGDEPGTTAVRDTAGNPPVRRAVDGDRSDPAERRDRYGAARRARSVDHRSGVSERVGAILERQHAAAIRRRYGRDRRLPGIARPRSANLAQPQSAGGGVRPFPALSASSPILPWRDARQHHAGGKQRLFELPGRVRVCHEAAVARPAVRHVLYLVEIARHQLTQLVGFALQDGYDIPNEYGPSDFDARHRFVVSATYLLPFTRPCADARLADGVDRPGSERQPREHRHQQRQPQWSAEHGAPRSGRSDSHHRLAWTSGSTRRPSQP